MGEYYFLIIVAIVLLLVISIATGFYFKDLSEYEQKLKDIDYFNKNKIYLSKLTGSDKMYSKYKCSASVVNQFKSDKALYYLRKYFNFIKDDEEAINILKMLEELQKEREDIWRSQGKFVKFNDKFIPCKEMYYISPKGKSKLSNIFELDTRNIQMLIKQLELSNKQNGFVKNQRRLMTKSLRESVLQRDNYTCQKCGNSVQNEPNLLLEVDHIIPVSKGGKTELSNLQTLCWKCNRSKSNKC